MAGLTSSHHGGLMCHPTSTAGYTGQPALCGQSPGFEPQHHRKEAEAYITPGLGMTAPKSEAVQCEGWARAGLAWPALTPHSDQERLQSQTLSSSQQGHNKTLLASTQLLSFIFD